MSDLHARDLTVSAGGAKIVRDASLSVAAGEFVAVLGPNGAGKSTLLRAVLGLQAKTAGEVSYDGEDFLSLSPRARARRVAYLPQVRPLAWPIPVRDVVALGRFAYGGAPGRLAAADRAAVEAALDTCALTHLAGRAAASLSGGEVARMHLARAFAAGAPLLIADEPVASLDPRHQLLAMDAIRDFVRRGGGALVVVHDIGLAARYADRLVWMREGEIVCEGPTAETATPQRIEALFGVRARVVAAGAALSVTIDGLDSASTDAARDIA